MGEEGGQRARRDALDTAGLAQRRRANGGQLGARFVGEAADGGVVEVGREAQVLVAAEGLDVGGLAVEVAGIGGVDLDLLPHACRPRGDPRPDPGEAAARGFKVNADGQRRTLAQLLAYPDIGFGDLAAVWPQIGDWPAGVREQVEIDAAYAGYLDRQAADVEAFRRDENLTLPPDLDYANVGGLSNEVRSKLAAVRPLTLGQAGRIEGVTPGALTALLAHVKRDRTTQTSAA